MRKYAWILGLFGVAALAGCKKSPEPYEGGPTQEAGPPPGWQEVPPADEPLEETGPLSGVPEAEGEFGATRGMPLQLGDAIATLRDAAETIRTTDDLDHAALVRALDAVADGLTNLPDLENSEAIATTIRSYTQNIRASDPMSLQQADWAKAALNEAAHALEIVGNARNVEGFSQRVELLDALVAQMNAEQPLLDQRQNVANTLDQIAEAMQILAILPSGTR